MAIAVVALHLQKNVLPFLRERKLFTQTASRGVAALQRWQKSMSSGASVLTVILFYRAGMCACRDQRNEALAGALHRLHKSLIEVVRALMCVGRAAV